MVMPATIKHFDFDEIERVLDAHGYAIVEKSRITNIEATVTIDPFALSQGRDPAAFYAMAEADAKAQIARTALEKADLQREGNRVKALLVIIDKPQQRAMEKHRHG